MKETGLPNPDNDRHRAWEDVTNPRKIEITRNEEGEPTGYRYVTANWLLDQCSKQKGLEPPKQARLANPDE